MLGVREVISESWVEEGKLDQFRWRCMGTSGVFVPWPGSGEEGVWAPWAGVWHDSAAVCDSANSPLLASPSHLTPGLGPQQAVTAFESGNNGEWWVSSVLFILTSPSPLLTWQGCSPVFAGCMYLLSKWFKLPILEMREQFQYRFKKKKTCFELHSRTGEDWSLGLLTPWISKSMKSFGTTSYHWDGCHQSKPRKPENDQWQQRCGEIEPHALLLQM